MVTTWTWVFPPRALIADIDPLLCRSCKQDQTGLDQVLAPLPPLTLVRSTRNKRPIQSNAPTHQTEAFYSFSSIFWSRSCSTRVDEIHFRTINLSTAPRLLLCRRDLVRHRCHPPPYLTTLDVPRSQDNSLPLLSVPQTHTTTVRVFWDVLSLDGPREARDRTCEYTRLQAATNIHT